jgi:hypothetical protein
MKRNVLIVSVLFILLVSACGSQPTPTANPADIQATSQAAAFTMVAQTQQAIPTPTQIPPTEIPSQTPLPSVTPIPLPTQAGGTQQAGATQTGQTLPGLPTAAGALPAGLPTFTPQSLQPTASSGNNQDICNQPLTSWQGPTAKFGIQNETKPQGTIVLSMYVVTELNQCGYLIITGDGFTGPVGQYSAAAFITGKQNFKAFGSFRITEGSWSVVVRNDSIVAKGGCSPNC